MDMALQSVPVATAKERADRTRTLRRFRLGDNTFRIMTQCSAIAVLVLLAGVMLSLVIGSLPAWRAFGLGFFTSQSWNPVTEKFGALPAVYGTLVTSFIAMLIGVPVSLGIAIFLTEICPERLRRPIGIAVELLAGIPSIIYGIWGLFVFAPLFAEHAQPRLQEALGDVPVIGSWFSGPPIGVGILAASIVLSLMVIPFIASVMRDVFETVPHVLKESAYGMGCTTWEVVRNIVLPYTRVGVIGGIMLGLGRALGETMAVTFVIGNANRINGSLFAPGTSIASTLANEFGEADPGLHIASLFALGLVLFVITFVVLAISRWLISRGIGSEGL